MITRRKWFEIYEGKYLRPKAIIPINDEKKLYIMAIDKNKVVVIEKYDGYEIEDRDVHLHKLDYTYDCVGENEYEINFFIVYRKKRYFLRDYFEKKE